MMIRALSDLPPASSTVSTSVTSHGTTYSDRVASQIASQLFAVSGSRPDHGRRRVRMDFSIGTGVPARQLRATQAVLEILGVTTLTRFFVTQARLPAAPMFSTEDPERKICSPTPPNSSSPSRMGEDCRGDVAIRRIGPGEDGKSVAQDCRGRGPAVLLEPGRPIGQCR